MERETWGRRGKGGVVKEREMERRRMQSSTFSPKLQTLMYRRERERDVI